VRTAYTLMDEIDRNADLSPDAKYRQRSKTAAQAIADFEASKTLARAREAVRYVMEKWNRDDVSPEIAKARDATLKAMKEAEQGWQKAIDKIADRANLTKGPDTRR
jgi:lipopolysaccharide biosynthesis regulator YciM